MKPEQSTILLIALDLKFLNQKDSVRIPRGEITQISRRIFFFSPIQNIFPILLIS